MGSLVEGFPRGTIELRIMRGASGSMGTMSGMVLPGWDYKIDDAWALRPG